IVDDVEAGLARLEDDLDLAGGADRIDLQGARVHAVSVHRPPNLAPRRVVPDPADQQRIETEAGEVPGDVERCSAENATAVLETVEQDLAEHHRAPLSGARRHAARAASRSAAVR